jgi:ferredoxin-NADP reductase
VPDALTLTVTELTAHTPTTRCLRLALAGVPFAFDAGQGVAIGRHGQPERRPYSLACSPDDARQRDGLEFLLRTDAQGRLGRHLDGLAPGMQVDVEGPFGDFTLPTPLPDVPLLFVAGGTGIAPLRAMMRAAKARGHGAPMHLLYSVRALDDVAFADEWAGWTHDGRGDVAITVTRPPGLARAPRLDGGLIAPIIDRSPGVLCFVCGPPGFVSDMERALSHLGVRADHIRREGW